MNDTGHIFSKKDLQQLKEREISPGTAQEQLAHFRRGNLFVRLIRACTIGDGIRRLSSTQIDQFIREFRIAEANGRVCKFVPASGAATRMFSALLAVLNDPEKPDWQTVKQRAEKGDDTSQHLVKFISNLPRFAFYDSLSKVLKQRGEHIANLCETGHYLAILEALLLPDGLNYAVLPKGMIEFHQYTNGTRTPFAEHLVETAAYAKDSNTIARIHFTITEDPAIQQQVKTHIATAQKELPQNGAQFQISYSSQKPSTDIIAVDMDNQPFRENDGSLHFRPGGHGALLENLNDLQGDIIFIKNIDNVTPDDRKHDTIRYKAALGGYLLHLQDQIFSYLKQLEYPLPQAELLAEIQVFLRSELSTVVPAEIFQASLETQQRYLFNQLNRPIRVCGMVKNLGEPGGGPFWVMNENGDVSLQVVETAQIETSDPGQKGILQSATHFSPVDFICGVRDYRGEPFDLHQFRDPDSGFITNKFKDGRELKALELPGLWNGGMAYWNSVFVEVPDSTFNPVKTVLDLLRPAHQPIDEETHQSLSR